MRENRPGSGLLIYGHLPPAQLELRPWFADRRLQRLAAGQLTPVPQTAGASR